MNTADRRWLVVTVTVVTLLAGSWLFPKGRGPQDIPFFPLLKINCSLTTAGNCESLMGSGSFWEANGGTDNTITAELSGQPIDDATCYSLVSGPDGDDATTRMPRNWQFSGSTDGKQWELLDSKTGETGWKLNEARYYPIRKKAGLKYIQIRIQPVAPSDIIRLYQLRLGRCSQDK